MGKWSVVLLVSLLIVLGYFALDYYGYSFPTQGPWDIIRLIVEWITTIAFFMIFVSLICMIIFVKPSKTPKKEKRGEKP